MATDGDYEEGKRILGLLQEKLSGWSAFAREFNPNHLMRAVAVMALDERTKVFLDFAEKAFAECQNQLRLHNEAWERENQSGIELHDQLRAAKRELEQEIETSKAAQLSLREAAEVMQARAQDAEQEVARLRDGWSRNQKIYDERGAAMRKAGIVTQYMGKGELMCIPTSDEWAKREWDALEAEVKALRQRPTADDAERAALLRMAIGVAQALGLSTEASPEEILAEARIVSGKLKITEAWVASLRNELLTASACMANGGFTLEMNGCPGQAERFAKWAKEFEEASDSTTLGQEWLDRLNKAEDRNFGDGTETEELCELIRHAWVHTAYPSCGYSQMTTEQKRLFDNVIGMQISETGDE